MVARVTAVLAKSNGSLTAKNWDHLRNPALGNLLLATFTFTLTLLLFLTGFIFGVVPN